MHTCDVTCTVWQGGRSARKRLECLLCRRFYLTGHNDANRSVIISLSLPPSLLVTSWYWAAFCWNHRNATHFVFTAQSCNTLISFRVCCAVNAVLRCPSPCSVFSWGRNDASDGLNSAGFVRGNNFVSAGVCCFFSSSSSSAAFPTWDQVDSVCVCCWLEGHLGREVSTPDCKIHGFKSPCCVFFFF